MSRSAQVSGDNLSASNPGGNAGSDGLSPLTLSRVVKNAQDPSRVFDLIGDGSGAMGEFCIPTGTGANNGAQSGTGPTTCSCTYTYTRADGSTVSYDAPTAYRESNLIRCSYADVPSTASLVKIKIHLTNSDSYTNEVTFRFTGTGLTLDLSNAASFAEVRRYQCREVVTIPYILDPSRIYDPIQSTDPYLTAPMNFYSTNVGGALAVYSANALTDFECPALPNDEQFGVDLRIFSKAADSAGRKNIYPPGSGFDRSTFYLAKQASGVFNIPVNAYIAPHVYSQSPDSQGNAQNSSPLPVGYGASPIPAGAGRETCPTVTIPTGYQWVKVWLFRAALTPRKYRTSSNLTNDLRAVACNPGNWLTSTDAGTAVFSQCGAGSTSIDAAAAASGAVSRSRILGSGACVNVTPSGSTDPITGSLTATYSSFTFAPKSDVWAVITTAGPYSCGSRTQPMNLCSPDFGASTPVPHTSSVTLVNYDTESTPPRFDFLFVVSPQTVMAADMQNSTSSVNLIYTPYRFMKKDDCRSGDPDAPDTAGDCAENRAIRNYGLKLHDVGNNGDPSGDDPSRAGVFPVCAIQPTGTSGSGS